MSPYEAEKAFFLYIFRATESALPGTDPNMLPDRVLDRMEQKSMAIARRGLREAINDTLSATAHLEPDQIKILDPNLRNRGLPTLTQMRAKYWSRHRNLMKRNKVKTEAEYYLIKSTLDGTDNGSNEERKLMSIMLNEYENINIKYYRK